MSRQGDMRDRGVNSTTGAGAPAPSYRNSLTIGPDGPVLLHDVHFLEQMAHFKREKVIERPELLQDPKWRTNSARAVNRAEVMATLEAIFAADTRDAWVTRCRKAGVPAGPVRSVAEAMESPELKERDMVVTVPHPTAGTLRMLGTPFKLSETPTKAPTAPPLLGEHTEAVLRDLLGMDDASLARLKESKTIP